MPRPGLVMNSPLDSPATASATASSKFCDMERTFLSGCCEDVVGGVVKHLGEDDCLVAALACTPLRNAVRGAYPQGIRTSAHGVVSSLKRFLWVRDTFPVLPLWLKKWNAITCRVIAGHGRLEILKWVREHGCEWNYGTCHAAAKQGHMEVLRFARANGCSWNADTCHAAAARGHLHILQWARANGCPWNAGTCMVAARGGHLEVLQFARKHGCEWDGSVCRVAALGGPKLSVSFCTCIMHTSKFDCIHVHDACSSLFIGQSCSPWPVVTVNIATSPVRGHLEVWEWARANGCAGGKLAHVTRPKMKPNLSL
jgi:hypothetical protein